MNPLNQFKAIPPLLIALALLGFALLPKAQAVVPAPDGGYPGFTTAEGTNALKNLTTGIGNTATGWHSLFANTAGNLNTGVGAGALLFNTGDNNTATGALALLNNTSGFQNTADGAFALFSNSTGAGNTGSGYQTLYLNQTGDHNTAYGNSALYNNTGSFNTAYGSQTLVFNTTGGANTAAGYQALVFNTTGGNNTASGYYSLRSNTTGTNNIGIGREALVANTMGNSNVAIGYLALSANTTGLGNIAVGFGAGGGLTTGSENINIGESGPAGESGVIRIGHEGTHGATYIAGIYGTFNTANSGVVYVDPDGKLGTGPSARRFKKDIADMGADSEVLLSMRPVSFHFKKQDTEKAGREISQFGLIAEEVAEVNPDLILRDKEGEIYSVRYDAVNAMLLNEFLKEHRKNEKQEATIAQLKSTLAKKETIDAHQQKQIEALAAGLQKVSAQLEASKSAPQVVLNNQ
jgi:Chaperone of endosialidase